MSIGKINTTMIKIIVLVYFVKTPFRKGARKDMKIKSALDKLWIGDFIALLITSFFILFFFNKFFMPMKYLKLDGFSDSVLYY